MSDLVMSILNCGDGTSEPRTDVDALQAVHSFGHIWLILQNHADKFCDYFNGDWRWDIQPVDQEGTMGIEFVNLGDSGDQHFFTFDEFAAKLVELWPDEFEKES